MKIQSHMDFFRAVFLCLMIFAATAVQPAFATQEPSLKLVVNNKTNVKVYVAVAIEGTTSYYVRGWYGVEAGQSKTLNFTPLPGSKVYYYAENKKAKMFWRGGNGSETLAVHPKNSFKHFDGEEGPGCVSVDFRPVKVKWTNDGWSGSATLNLTK